MRYKEAIDAALYWDRRLRNGAAVSPSYLPEGTWIALDALWRGRDKHEKEEYEEIKKERKRKEAQAELERKNKDRYKE